MGAQLWCAAMNRLTILSLALLSGCATTSSTAFFPLDELRALDDAENRAEVLERALQVAPSKRNDEWRGVVERAAIATMAETEVTDLPSAERALEQSEALPAKFPFLKRSAGWLGKRADMGVKALPYLSQQRGERSAWAHRILEFAKSDAVTPHLAQRLADEVLLKQLIASTAVPLFELALERDGEAACTSASLQKAALEVAADGSVFTTAMAKCWKELAGPMTDAAKKAPTYTEKLKLCAAMKPHAEEPAVKAACAE